MMAYVLSTIPSSRGGGGGGDNFSLYKADKDKTIVFWAGPSTIS